MDGKAFNVTLTAAVETNAAMPLEVRRVASAVASGGTVDVEIVSPTTPLPASLPSPEALAHASFLAGLIANYVGPEFESPEAGLIVGVLLYVMMIEFARLRG